MPALMVKSQATTHSHLCAAPQRSHPVLIAKPAAEVSTPMKLEEKSTETTGEVMIPKPQDALVMLETLSLR